VLDVLLPHKQHQQGDDVFADEFESGTWTDSESGSEDSAKSEGFGARLVGCLTIMRPSSTGEDDQRSPRHAHHIGRISTHHYKLPAGCTFAVSTPQLNSLLHVHRPAGLLATAGGAALGLTIVLLYVQTDLTSCRNMPSSSSSTLKLPASFQSC
jgi:hypothetical protein